MFLALKNGKVIKKEETLTPKILQMKLNHLIANRGKKGADTKKQIETLRILSSRVSFEFLELHFLFSFFLFY